MGTSVSSADWIDFLCTPKKGFTIWILCDQKSVINSASADGAINVDYLLKNKSSSVYKYYSIEDMFCSASVPLPDVIILRDLDNLPVLIAKLILIEKYAPIITLPQKKPNGAYFVVSELNLKNYHLKHDFEKVNSSCNGVKANLKIAHKKSVNNQSSCKMANLSPRELEILSLVKDGNSHKEIAKLLAISTNTVSHHLKSIFLKLNVDNKINAIFKAIEMNILQ